MTLRAWGILYWNGADARDFRSSGVFREMAEIKELTCRFRTEVGIRLRVITGQDEAKLMARGFKPANTGSTFLCDLGGASTEWASYRQTELREWGSLALGAIRNQYKFAHFENDAERYLQESEQWCDAQLAKASVDRPSRLLVTGGSVRALASCVGADSISTSTLRDMIHEVLQNGAPAELSDDRRTVFLAGLIILLRAAKHGGAEVIECSERGLRSGLTESLLQVLQTKKTEDLHSTLLLRTVGE